MIFNIRGLSGAGKTTTALAIKSLYDQEYEFNVSQSDNGTGSILTDSTGKLNPLLVLGVYYHEFWGGCDRYDNPEQCLKLCEYFHARGHNILYESMRFSVETSIPLQLAKQEIDFVCWSLELHEDEIFKQRVERSQRRGRDRVFRTKTCSVSPSALTSAHKKLVGVVKHAELVKHPTPQERTAHIVASYCDFVKKQGPINPLPFEKTTDLVDLFCYTSAKFKQERRLPEHLFDYSDI